MNFELNDDHKSVQELCRDFAAKYISPTIAENDRAHKFDPSIFKRMAEADILGLCIPEKFGGAGMDYIWLGLACEELEYADGSARGIL